MGEPYLWRTANMSGRTCVVVKQMQSNPILSAQADQSQTEIDQHNLEAKEQRRIHITDIIISDSKYQHNTF